MSTGLLPRDSVLVKFQTDPVLWHHRVILSEPLGVDAAQYVLTPDRRVKLQRFGFYPQGDPYLQRQPRFSSGGGRLLP